MVLMAAFVGLGLGCSFGSLGDKDKESTNKLQLSAIFPVLVLIISAVLVSAETTGLSNLNFLISPDIFLWTRRGAVISSVAQLAMNVVIVVGLFLLVVAIFESIGQLLGRELAKHDPLPSYEANLAGSLFGIVGYSLLSYLHCPPVVWLLVGFACLASFYRKKWQLATLAACLVLVFAFTYKSTWSPYYRVDIKPFMSDQLFSDLKPYQLGSEVLANHKSFQRPIDLSNQFVEKHPELKESAEYTTYNLPYLANPESKDVLVLGAGSGNDVSAALRNGAERIDAVEIDPVILNSGKDFHPEKPYENPKVNLYVNDARAFLAGTDMKYDAIVFGFVDSQTSFSSLSSVRLDNFLYTVESLKQATNHLKDNGVVTLSFASGPAWLRARLYQMARKVSDQEPLAIHSIMSNPNSIVLVWGPGLEKARAQLEAKYSDRLFSKAELSQPISLCNDDWPFLYQKDKAIVIEYVVMLVFLIAISTTLTISKCRLEPSAFLKYGQFFLLGAGFLLLETRGILAVSILFGSTWFVNSIVFSFVLLMALLANWLVKKFDGVKQGYFYVGVFASLLILYFVPVANLASQSLAIKLIGALLLIGSPFLFSGLVFSRAFKFVSEPHKALGINIVGAVFGGALEYFSVVVGIKNLGLIAIGIYALSVVAIYLAGSVRSTQPGTSSGIADESTG